MENLEEKYEDYSGVNKWDLLKRRKEVSEMLKLLSEERKELDRQLIAEFEEEELTRGLAISEGSNLKLHYRTSWEYDTEVLEEIEDIKKRAISEGCAVEITTRYLKLSGGNM
jgi:hypothetical protein